MRRACLVLLLLVAGCQTEARRLLVVDFTVADPLTLEATAAPWHAAGYRIEYRQVYPHLTRQDLSRYRTVLVLGGREPESASDALTIGDLAILNEWLRRDGVIVLGYRSEGSSKRDVGTLDRWVMNRWLAALGAGITIGTEQFDAPMVPLPHSALDNAGFAPFPGGKNLPLKVRERGQTLARAGASAPALVAASRVGDGLIVVASRSLLASGGEDSRTRAFLEALARWTRRPAEWASVGAASRPAPLRLAGAPQPVVVHAPPLRPPAGAPAIALPQPVSPSREAETAAAPGWISRQGMRVLWSRFTPQSLDSLLGFVDVAALNALATVIPVAALADTLGTRNIWKVTGQRLQATSVRWFPAVSLVALAQGNDEVNRHGDLTPIACGLDSVFWRGALRPAYRTLTRLGGARPDVIAGVALDLDSAMTLYRGSGFCDVDYHVGLAALGLDGAETDRLGALPPAVRYDTLLERGWLGPYFDALQAAVTERASALRGELRRLHPELRFAFHATEVPTDWFSLGLLRGFSSADAPVLLWLRERHGRALLQHYRDRQIFALSATQLNPREPRVRATVFSENDGFWLDAGGAATDSLGRLIRRFTR